MPINASWTPAQIRELELYAGGPMEVLVRRTEHSDAQVKKKAKELGINLTPMKNSPWDPDRKKK